MTTNVSTEVLQLNNVFQKTSINGNWITDVAALSSLYGGWICGGYGSAAVSTVQKITYATDTATTSLRGTLGRTFNWPTGVTSMNNGWVGGGAGPVSTVLGITYATDTATATVRTNLLTALLGLTGVNSATNGWFAGGGTASNVIGVTSVQGIIFATDTAAPTLRGNLAITLLGSGGVGNTTNGWFCAGAATVASTASSNTQSLTYATDTAVASIRGNLPIASIFHAATTNSSYGWLAACGAGGSVTSVERITFATDTAVGSTRGNLATGTASLPGGIGNATNGWICGGSPSTPITNVQGITYATDTAVASQRGKLTTGVMETGSL